MGRAGHMHPAPTQKCRPAGTEQERIQKDKKGTLFSGSEREKRTERDSNRNRITLNKDYLTLYIYVCVWVCRRWRCRPRIYSSWNNLNLFKYPERLASTRKRTDRRLTTRFHIHAEARTYIHTFVHRSVPSDVWWEIKIPHTNQPTNQPDHFGVMPASGHIQIRTKNIRKGAFLNRVIYDTNV